MKDMTFGTFLSCLFLSFMLGFLACHKLYVGLNKDRFNDISNVWRNNSSLHGSDTKLLQNDK